MIDLTDYGFDPSAMPQNTPLLPARIIAVHKDRYELVCMHGRTFGRLKSGIYYFGSGESFPTTGDFVLIDYNSCGDSIIVKTLDRRSYFSRRDPAPGNSEQAVAANFDYVFIMASLNQDFNVRRIERYLTLSWQSGATPVIILTKADLAPDFGQQLQALEAVAFGTDIHAISIKTGRGLSELSKYLKPGSTIVLLGSSGVGKSSLINALAEEKLMDVGAIRASDGKGRHTTTIRQLVKVASGAMIIDTPGMRELGMWNADSGLSEIFADIESYIGKCRFSDCQHGSEPGCAVKEAIKKGELTQERFERYLKLKKESRFATDKDSAMKAKQE